MERVSDHLDLEHLKKISAVCVSDPEGAMQIGSEGEEQGEGPSQPLSQDMGSPSELGEHLASNPGLPHRFLRLQKNLRRRPGFEARLDLHACVMLYPSCGHD